MLSVAARPCRIAAVRGTVSVLFAQESARGFETMTSALFSPITLRGLTLANRVVVSPMCQYNSNNGSANDWHLMHLGSFSLGCGGLVMCEMTNVNPIGRISPKCAGMYSDENEVALKRVHDFCRTYGVAKLGVQLAHAGRKGPTMPPAAGGEPILTQAEGVGLRRRHRQSPTTPAGRCRSP
jgi:2,4-dienoyl-CoA reductase-like NADH-dependent reductase (Old Yellow Enzyme family)